MKGSEIRKRREALGLTQKDLADEVARRAGRSFSQQSLQKLEAKEKAASRFMHHILTILEEAEAGDRTVIKGLVDQVDEQHLPAVRTYLEMLVAKKDA